MSRFILAIEDDQSISELYQELFTEAGYRVQLMESKPTHLQIIEELLPDLLISDWGIKQEKTNWAFIDAMQGTPATAAIPILVCTALPINLSTKSTNLNERKIRVLEKPFDIEELLQVVGEIISNDHNEVFCH